MKIKLLLIICLLGILKLNAQDSIGQKSSLIQYSTEKELMDIHPMLKSNNVIAQEKKPGMQYK